MKRIHYVFILIAFLSVCSNQSLAQWIQIGPDKGPVTSLASMGNSLFAGTAGGVFMSGDGGNTWMHPMSEIWAREITSLAVMGTEIFAAGPSPQSGLYRSVNNGYNWTDVRSGLPAFSVLDLEILNSFVFVGTQGGGIYRSGNHGAGWIGVSAGLSADTVTSMTSVGPVLFAGTWGGGVFKSENNGDTWIPINSGLVKDTITAMASADNKLYAGTFAGNVFRSDDLGGSWTKIMTGVRGPGINSIAHTVSYLFVATYNGIYRAPDNSNVWTPVSQGNVGALYPMGASLYAAGSGVSVSSDNGDSWSDKSAGMKNASVLAMSMEGTTLFASTRDGLFSSENQGQTWSLYLDCGWTQSMAYTPDDFYAGCYGYMSYRPRNSANFKFTLHIDSINRIYALAARNNIVYIGTESRGLFRVVHYGTYLWDPPQLIGFPKTLVNGLLLDGTTLYAATAVGVYSTSDEGTHWTNLNNGLTNPYAYALIFKGTYLFAGTKNGVFRSSDHGANWTPANKGMEVMDVLSFAVKGNNLFAGTWNGGVMLSTDDGANWTMISHESIFDPWFKIPQVIHGLAADNDYIYAGERRTGVWRRPLSEIITSAELMPGDFQTGFSLGQNYPNPFRGTTTINFVLPAKNHATMKLFDVQGKGIAILFDETLAAGKYEISFNSREFPEGVYYYQLRSGTRNQTRRMIILK